jgi:hypothetical protein
MRLLVVLSALFSPVKMRRISILIKRRKGASGHPTPRKMSLPWVTKTGRTHAVA